MRNFSLLYGLLVASLALSAASTPVKFEDSLPVERAETVYRLPTAVFPNHYDISLVAYFTDGNSFFFTGDVTINFTVRSLTSVIIFHNQNLNINRNATTVTWLANDTLIDIVSQSHDSQRHFHILSFSQNLPLGNYSVALSFSGVLHTDMDGFYRSSYQVGNETRWLVATQFQPTSARRAFPCFDEPGFKSTFSVRLAHFQNQTALSNMPSSWTTLPDNTIGGRVWTQFETTPVMSTYILAFVVSDFESISSNNQFFGIWSRKEALNSTAWALEATKTLYPMFLSTVQTTDPWPKIDQIAIPDFSAGAMENWGLITYRERLLLWEDGESNSRSRELIASIISHELAHIWFGNLVSPVWWDHLWFNEGFATLYEYLMPADAYPEWRFAERFVTEHQMRALLSDSLETTRPMANVVGSPGSVLASFDTIAYSKSGAVLNMMNRILTPQFFSRALSNFLTQSAHGTFDPTSLWAHLQAVADVTDPIQNHMPIAAIMDSWVNQPGYPLVTVWRNYSTTVVAFSQERFFRNRNSPTADPESQRWWIPISYATGNNPSRCNQWAQPDWLRAQDKAIMMAGVNENNWIIAHCQGIGFYRTNYDTRNWEMLTEFLRGPTFSQLNAINRAVLIDDSFNLARAGYIGYPIPLRLSTYLAQETDFVAWRATIPLFTYLDSILASEDFFSAWQAYQQSLALGLYTSLGWVPGTTDSHEVRLHRQQILDLACRVDLANARASAEAQFDLWITNPQLNSVDPDLRSVVYCWGSKTASEESWDIMWNRFLATNYASEEDLLLRGLACSQNSTILLKYLQLSITANSGIRLHDTFTVFTSILTNGNDNLDLLLDFVANNAEAISQFYGGINVITRMLAGISSHITRPDQLEKLRAVSTSEVLGVSINAARGAIQTAIENLEWISNYAPAIQDWLRNQGFDPVATTDEITTTTPETGDDGGASAFSSSLILIFASVVMCMTNY